MFGQTLNVCASTCKPNDAKNQVVHELALQSMDRRDPKFQRTLEAGLSHLKSLMEMYHQQNEQGRCILHENPHHSWRQGTTALQNLECVSGARVTATWHVHDQLPSDC